VLPRDNFIVPPEEAGGSAEARDGKQAAVVRLWKNQHLPPHRFRLWKRLLRRVIILIVGILVTHRISSAALSSLTVSGKVQQPSLVIKTSLSSSGLDNVSEKNTEDDSEQDEQRMVARRRFSYENIDGVGDDASSDSRGRTDHDSTDDISK
ncbi:hypothetical protein OSTOST_20704, partial [Ostertagia ostertagi]